MTAPAETQESLPLLFSHRSHVGRVREVNEDYLGYVRAGGRQAFLVADGMGGAVGGALASRAAVEAASAALKDAEGGTAAERLAAAVEAANAACLELQRQRPELEGMGTTLDIALIEGARAWWAHVGDGRIYHVREGGHRLLTRDHSVVQKMVDEGLLAPGDASRHPHRHVLNRVLGREERVEADLALEPLEMLEGDSLVLCTDGLTDLVSGNEIASLVESQGPASSCERLVELALDRGGSDNVTVQVIHRGSPRRSWRRSRAEICR